MRALFVTCLYVGTYYIFRWQNILVRANAGHTRDGIKSSRIRAGFWLVDTGFWGFAWFKEPVGEAGVWIFKPLCLLEIETRNRFWN